MTTGTCARAGCARPVGRGCRFYCSRACQRQPRPTCARPGCTNRCRTLRGTYCGKSCAARARGAEFAKARRRGGRATWLKHGRPAYLRRVAALEARPDVVSASGKGEAFSRGITHGLGLAYQHVVRFYQRARGAVPPGLLEELQAYSRRKQAIGRSVRPEGKRAA